MYESFWAAVTLLGDPRLSTIVVLGLTALYFLIWKLRLLGKEGSRFRIWLKRYLLLIIPALGLTFLGTELLKLLFQVQRPCVMCPAIACNPYCHPTFSFPSGHAATITGIVTALYLLLRNRKYIVIYALPILVAVSRVALGVHNAVDVIAGFAFGLCMTLLIYRYRRKIYKLEDEIL